MGESGKISFYYKMYPEEEGKVIWNLYLNSLIVYSNDNFYGKTNEEILKLGRNPDEIKRGEAYLKFYNKLDV